MDLFDKFKIWVLLVCLISQLGHGFYLPGSYPIKHVIGGALSVKVNSLTSIDTEIPFSYYSLPFSNPLSKDEFKILKKRIDDMYQVNLILDNLPAISYTTGYFLHWTGYPVGVKVQNSYYVFNHLKFTVLVHKYEETNVVGVMGTEYATDVIPTGGKSGSDVPDTRLQSSAILVLWLWLFKEGEPVAFTYEVEFVESDIKWPSRWDAYLKMEGEEIHWFSILNSLILAGIVLVILLRKVRRDLTRYEELDKEAQAQMNEDLLGWKLVVGDVFRAPTNASLLCMLFFYMILGIAAGYVAVRLWRTIGCGEKKGWASVSWKVACFFPGIAFLILTTSNFLLWGSHSTGAIPFSLFVILIFAMVLHIDPPYVGTVGFLSSFWFVHYLLSSVKLD
ncbi:endomembrane protein 70 protein family [Actinidia rufa]|uniref:Transmembrane 9 superfamily member n=1 Tax=Actinidia rufa TaxID=165716 RepID=A0A7J0DIC1_9ERIC|nr:endomembrane protein 70 protein family [Actinidia rufa]